jgi:hypothetical protein
MGSSRAGGFSPTAWASIWLVSSLYLSFQLISIPFAQGAQNRFIGVVDGLASVIPLGIVVVVLFGK